MKSRREKLSYVRRSIMKSCPTHCPPVWYTIRSVWDETPVERVVLLVCDIAVYLSPLRFIILIPKTLCRRFCGNDSGYITFILKSYNEVFYLCFVWFSVCRIGSCRNYYPYSCEFGEGAYIFCFLHESICGWNVMKSYIVWKS